MTKEQALHAFWSGFGLTAYEENAVPRGDLAPDFPYITYQVSTDSFGADVQQAASLWYRSTSWAGINAKTEEISRSIGKGGRLIAYDGGAVWIKRGTPFAQSMGDESDAYIKRKYLNLTVEFLSTD